MLTLASGLSLAQLGVTDLSDCSASGALRHPAAAPGLDRCRRGAVGRLLPLLKELDDAEGVFRATRVALFLIGLGATAVLLINAVTATTYVPPMR